MPPSEPLREQVLAAVATQLDSIAADSVYWTTPSVTRRPLALDQYEAALRSGVILGVVRSSGSTFLPDSQATFDDRFRFAVWGYVRGDASVPSGTWLERLWADHARALLADPTLGGLTIQLLPDGVTDTDDGALEPYGTFAQDWLALLRNDLNA